MSLLSFAFLGVKCCRVLRLYVVFVWFVACCGFVFGVLVLFVVSLMCLLFLWGDLVDSFVFHILLLVFVKWFRLLCVLFLLCFV